MAFHNYLIQNQENLDKALGFNMSQFKFENSSLKKKFSKCIEQREYESSILINKKIASELEISSVPATVISKDLYVGLLKENDYRKLIESFLDE